MLTQPILNGFPRKTSRDAKLAIIVPAYNEKENIHELVRRTEKTLDNICF